LDKTGITLTLPYNLDLD